jgi:Zn-dependent protease with chaperone function
MKRTLPQLQKLVDRVAAKAKVTGLKAIWYPVIIADVFEIPNSIDPNAIAGSDSETKIIAFGGMADAFTDMELCSIIAHEIGHIVANEPSGNPAVELRADAYAAKLGYAGASISAFKHVITAYPQMAAAADEITHPTFQARIAAIQKWMKANPTTS